LPIFQRTPSLEGTGLKKDSILLIDKMATVENTFIKGILGEANADLRLRVNTKIAQFLMFDDGPVNGL